MVCQKRCLGQILPIMDLKQIWIILMHNSDEFNVCRVCGAKQPEPPWGDDGLTPSYEICDCCGVEFGYEDMNINALKRYREKWLKKGAVWFNDKEKPAEWSLDEQLKNIPEKYL